MDLSSYFNIGLGVVSGIITSFILLLMTLSISKIILPWYLSLIYKGVNISGTWVATLEDDEESEKAQLDVKMSGSNLTAVLYIVKTKDNSIVKYEFSGGIKDRLITLCGRNSENKRLSASVLLLEVLCDGNTLSGYECWYSVVSSKPKSALVQFYRK